MKNFSKDLLALITKPILTKVHKFKDIHAGESCYLIGGGISLKWFDLAAFSGKISLPLGFLPFHNYFHKLNAEYCVLPEPWWFYPFKKTTIGSKGYIKNSLQIAYRDVIKRHTDKEFFLNLSNYPVLRDENITYLFRGLYDHRLSSSFITNRINAFHGSFRTAILLAIYMGFDHVYLVGCDYTHNPSRAHHWFEKGHGVFFQNQDYQKDFFEIASEFISITSITLDGASNFINSVTYKEHTGLEPMYKENIELLDDRCLELLATWPDYKIY